MKQNSKPERSFTMRVYVHTKANGKLLWLAYSASRNFENQHCVGTHTVQARNWIQAGNRAIALAKAALMSEATRGELGLL